MHILTMRSLEMATLAAGVTLIQRNDATAGWKIRRIEDSVPSCMWMAQVDGPIE